MYELQQYLLSCGYEGPCENLDLLKWAIRAGASSQYFNDLVKWLESQLSLVISTQTVRDNIKSLFSMLRHSFLMKRSYGSDAAVNPKEFRLQTIKVLIRQLELRRLPERLQNVGGEIPRNGSGNVQDFTHLTITFNMTKNQRLVRFNTKF